jgi:hypothetical protein
MSEQLDKPTRASVQAAIDRARDNGYCFDDWSDEQIAVDICSYDSTHESCEVADVAKIVAEIRSGADGR